MKKQLIWTTLIFAAAFLMLMGCGRSRQAGWTDRVYTNAINNCHTSFSETFCSCTIDWMAQNYTFEQVRVAPVGSATFQAIEDRYNSCSGL